MLVLQRLIVRVFLGTTRGLSLWLRSAAQVCLSSLGPRENFAPIFTSLLPLFLPSFPGILPLAPPSYDQFLQRFDGLRIDESRD